ncbi:MULTISPECIES: SMI1/KNR4 family protein [unclassified Paenibacillus]|uniref:SMI1/KNR4 family protein n=1 Tax=unclassified Paenibacillus TaxID=185978 RepID=UPI000FE1F2C2|nr:MULTISPECIES: SMI1/KNR4 family protein [unclassified Paenibacillus]MCM3170799.1 SMI1/KNR4 family protein [Paenibacillus sp. MER 99-2]
MAEVVRVHDKVSLEQIENFENTTNIKLPTLYRDFLLEYNGGRVQPNVFKISSDEGESALNIFYGIGSMRSNLEKKFDFFDDILEIGFIPIASDSGGNQVCLGVTEEFYEQIYFWIHDEEYDEAMENMFFLAKNINEFIGSLYDTE